MSLKFITIYSGGEHIEATDDAEIFKAVFGSGNFVFNHGGKLAITVLPTTGAVSISDGVFIFDGRLGRVIVSDTVTYTPPASESLWKKIAVLFRYNKNTSTGIESGSLICIEGSVYGNKTVAEAQTLSIGSGEISSGTTTADFLLYEFVCNSNSYDSLTTYFTLKSATAELEAYADTKATAAFLSAKKYIHNYSAPTQIFYDKNGTQRVQLAEPFTNFREIVIYYSVTHGNDTMTYQKSFLTACLTTEFPIFLDAQRIWAYGGGEKKIMYSAFRLEIVDDKTILEHTDETNVEAANTYTEDISSAVTTKIHAVFGIHRI